MEEEMLKSMSIADTFEGFKKIALEADPSAKPREVEMAWICSKMANLTLRIEAL